MKNGNFLRKRHNAKTRNATKRINKKHGKICKTTQLNRKNAKKSFKKQISRLKTPDFAAISSKNRAETPKKSPGKSCTRLKLVKAGKKTIEYAQKCLIKLQSDLISVKKHLKSAVNHHESHLKARFRGKYEFKVLYFASEKTKKSFF